MKYQVLFDGENVWQINGQPHYFDSFEEAGKELDEHFEDMDDAGMDYEPADYRIEIVN
jgi:CHASE3 domain sensor protein